VTASVPDDLAHLLGEAFTSNELGNLCASLRLPIAGSKDERIHRLVSAKLDPEELLGYLPNSSLAEACEVLGLAPGRKAEMIAALLAHTPMLVAAANVPAPEILEATRENVLRILQSKHVPRRALQAEDAVEVFVVSLLRPYFQPINQQYYVGGHLGAKIDIDVGGRVGVELKLASSLTKASEAYRLIGQALHYRRRYNADLIIGVAGVVTELESPMLGEMRDLLSSLGLTVAFLQAL